MDLRHYEIGIAGPKIELRSPVDVDRLGTAKDVPAVVLTYPSRGWFASTKKACEYDTVVD
jgi:hypothetical protein